MAPQLYKGPMDVRLRLIVASFLIAIGFLVFHQLFAPVYSNRCDPGNAQFSLMKRDPIATFSPDGRLFTWENAGPDNSLLCSNASLSESYVGPNVRSMFDQTRAAMTRSGWVGGEIFLKDQNFAVYEKDVAGVRLDAVLRREAFWVEVDMQAPGLHPGEYGFG